MQFFEEKKCILMADLLKKKVLSSRITYSVIDQYLSLIHI